VAAQEREIRIERTDGEGRHGPGATMAGAAEGVGFGDLLKRLGQNSAELIRGEMNLAKLEMKENISAYAGDAVKIGVGLALASVGGLALTAFLVLVIGNLLNGAFWAGALIVGGVFLLIGGIIAYSGIKDMKKRDLKPDQTLDMLQEDKRFIQREAKDFRREITA